MLCGLVVVVSRDVLVGREETLSGSGGGGQDVDGVANIIIIQILAVEVHFIE